MAKKRLYENLSEETAHLYGLILSASGIGYRLKKERAGWYLWVEEAESARAAIRLYLEENQTIHLSQKSKSFRKTDAGLVGAILMLAGHVAVAIQGDVRQILALYGSSAEHILGGEVFRAVTGLTLHVNSLHLIGNLLGILLFGTAVCSIMGGGLGWFLILVTGISGNLITALLYRTDHLSVGASTAVFGALGILAAYQFFQKIKIPGQRIKAWIPLGGGLALLGLLGSGQYVDMSAHFFGFLFGILFGCFYAGFIKRPAARIYQAGFLFLSLAIVAGSWAWALIRP